MFDVRRSLVALTQATRGLVVFLALLVGVILAWHHPVSPRAVTAAFLLWCVFVRCRPGVWLFVVPAALPLLNFAPWTGWVVVEEFDLLLLGVVGGGYARQAFAIDDPRRPADESSRHAALFAAAAIVFGLSSAVAGVRGFMAAKDVPLSLLQGYVDPLNALRAVKSVVFAALLWPLLRSELRRDMSAAVHRLAWGMVVGLAVVTLGVLWERLAYTGLWDFSTHYRTTALFWEMHVGGAAIDVYLALATPFVAWALWTVRVPWTWGLLAVLALGVGYACLTTFARGVFGAVLGSLLLLALLLRWRRRSGGRVRWRTVAGTLLVLALVVEVLAVLGLGSFMRDRLADAERDLDGRRQHWQQGLNLLETPLRWLGGIGAGRLPASYAQAVPRQEFPGEVQFVVDDRTSDAGHVRLLGPKTQTDIKGLLALTQRVALHPVLPHSVAFDLRSRGPADVYLTLCEMHLLYPRQCQSAWLSVRSEGTPWKRITLPLRGPLLDAGSAWAPRRAVFSVSVITTAAAVDIDKLSLTGPDRIELLANGDFSRGMARWFPSAQGHYVPWHIDSLYLELLIERGGAALLAFLTCMAVVIQRLVGQAGRDNLIAPFLAASLCGVCCVGLVSSVMDVPRVAFLMLLLMLFAFEVTRQRPNRSL